LADPLGIILRGNFLKGYVMKLNMTEIYGEEALICEFYYEFIECFEEIFKGLRWEEKQHPEYKKLENKIKNEGRSSELGFVEYLKDDGRYENYCKEMRLSGLEYELVKYDSEYVQLSESEKLKERLGNLQEKLEKVA
jgi:hypothetical protein